VAGSQSSPSRGTVVATAPRTLGPGIQGYRRRRAVVEWVCTECERSYHELPEACLACGNEAVVPADERGGSQLGRLLGNARDAVLDPANADRSLVRPSSGVDLAFRLLLLVSTLLVGLV